MIEQNNEALLRDYQTTITILEHLSEAIFILTPNGHIQYANRVATDLLGVSLSHILHKNLNDYLMAPFRFEENEKNFLEQIYQNGWQELETTLKNGDRGTPIVISFGFVRNGKDEVDYIIASAKDISLRKSLEKELFQQQLYLQSRDRYKELGELAINIVHRLSQPITSIRLLIEMMQNKLQTGQISNEQMNGHFQQISHMLNEMNEVITNVRNFAFLTEEETLKAVDVLQSLQNAIQHLQYELTESDVEISIHKDKNLPPILGNPLNVQQTFSALLRFFFTQFTNSPKLPNKTIQIVLKNVDDRWMEMVWYNGSFKEKVPSIRRNKKQSLESNFNLAVVQLMVNSTGGDFWHRFQKDGQHIFGLRFPMAHANDRQQLLNMIALM